MLLMVRSYVVTRTQRPLNQAGFIRSRVQSAKTLTEDIAMELEGLDCAMHATT